MSDETQKIVEGARRDGRFSPEAFFFVYQALEFARYELDLGGSSDEAPPSSEEDPDRETSRHITGQQLCEAIRQFALRQFGYLAECVLKSWGITKTGDFGEIVYCLIQWELMKKTPNDRREDFDDVFDFHSGLCQSFRISLPD